MHVEEGGDAASGHVAEEDDDPEPGDGAELGPGWGGHDGEDGDDGLLGEELEAAEDDDEEAEAVAEFGDEVAAGEGGGEL